jgi:hypothetical protein
LWCDGAEDLSSNEGKDQKLQPPIAVRLRGLKLQLGPELRMVYPLILNFAVNGELELNGFADSTRLKPKGALTFENGDVNLVATQVLLSTNPSAYHTIWARIRVMQFMTEVVIQDFICKYEMYFLT